MCDGNSASTDRSATIKGYGDAENIFSRLSGRAGKLNAAGDSDTGKASKYYSDILSGNPAAVMSAAAPEITAINKGADAQKNDIANFGDRTGGTNQTSQAISTTARGQVADTIAKQRAGAASGEATIGANEQGLGEQALATAGSQSLDLASVSGKNREISQKIHDDAVQQWASLVQEAFTFAAG
jgi:hypothetical protein